MHSFYFAPMLIAALTASTYAAPASSSGSRLSSYADTTCNQELSYTTDAPNDGVQGTKCQSLKVMWHTDYTKYRDLAQSVQLSNFQDGCTAYVYSGPDCHNDAEIAHFTKDSTGCQTFQGFGESFQIRCDE